MLSAKALLLTALLLAPACAASPAVDSQQAIQTATRECKSGHVALVGEPANIRARLMTLSEADKSVGGGVASAHPERSSDTQVWLIQMDGQLSLVGGPRPPNTPFGQTATPTPPSNFYGTCSVLVDANTGEAFDVTVGPQSSEPTTKPSP